MIFLFPPISLLPKHPCSRNSVFAAASPPSSPAIDAVNDPLPAVIHVTETQEPNSWVRLSVEVPPIVCEDCYKWVLQEFMKQAKVHLCSTSVCSLIKFLIRITVGVMAC